MTRRLFSRLLPAPLLSLALMALWLLLARAPSVGQCLIALILGLAIPVWLAPLRPARARIRHPLLVARFIAVTGVDVLRSNLEVLGSLVAALLGIKPLPRSRFVTVPLELRDPAALAALAAVCTVVPGTVWCELARDASQVRIHVWNVSDDAAQAAFIVHFKARYEQPLKIIFQS
ncbi:MAG: Na+/H+ antiporter subunit E [Burkholderiaceae bacterium]|jgi:multicomponent K+:H+ antiporter subunit E|nr:Na+/H+ antiporter subunit E [Burkholderiaceae bacterium]